MISSIEDPLQLASFASNFPQNDRLYSMLLSKPTTFEWQVDDPKNPNLILGRCALRPSYNLFIKNMEYLEDFLKNYKLSCDGSVIRFASFETRYAPLLEKHLMELGATNVNVSTFHLYKLSPEKANWSELESLAQGVTPIKLEDANIISTYCQLYLIVSALKSTCR